MHYNLKYLFQFCLKDKMINKNNIIIGLAFYMILFSSCSRLGCDCGTKVMSNEDYIKIEVRTGGEIALYAAQHPVPSDPPLITNSRIKIEICKKYGYSEDDFEKKKMQILDDLSLQWIQRNCQILSSQISPLPHNNEEWEKFFENNNNLLHQ